MRVGGAEVSPSIGCSFEDFEVQTALTFEMIIAGGLIDASLGDDVPHARALEPFSANRSTAALIMAFRVYSAGRTMASPQF